MIRERYQDAAAAAAGASAESARIRLTMKEPIILVHLRIDSPAASITTMDFQSKWEHDVMVMRKSPGARPPTRASLSRLMYDRGVAPGGAALASRVGRPSPHALFTMQPRGFPPPTR